MARRRPRHINIPLIKSLFMFVVGAVIAAGSALTGIGAPAAAEPAIDFLLGFTPERIAGTSIAFSFTAAALGAIGAAKAGLRIDTTQALILAVSAFVGALIASPVTKDPAFNPARRLAQTIAMMVCVFVLQSAVRAGPLGVRSWDIDLFHSAPGWIILGAVAGALSQAFVLASGVLLVPGLIYLAGISPTPAIVLSLTVITVASLLPALRYIFMGAVDRGAGFGMILGGALGGYGGGYLLASGLQHSTLPLIMFALTAMFLCARTIYKMS